jgi:hypothetical protein
MDEVIKLAQIRIGSRFGKLNKILHKISQKKKII